LHLDWAGLQSEHIVAIMQGPAVKIHKHKHTVLLNEGGSVARRQAGANFYNRQFRGHFPLPSRLITCTAPSMSPSPLPHAAFKIDIDNKRRWLRANARARTGCTWCEGEYDGGDGRRMLQHAALDEVRSSVRVPVT
jgi:hypothetical protein